MIDSNLVKKALFFAAKHHEGQKMKYPDDMPYSVHYFAVTLKALKYATKMQEINKEFLVCTAILHDTLEDTSATINELEENFGKQIADAVFALTKDESLPKEKQMVDCIKKIKTQPKEVSIVKMADRMVNISERVPSWSKEKQEAYKAEAKFICDNLGGACTKMKKDFEKLIENY